MDVRCERCRASYVVDDARIPEAGVKVACTQCGHGFQLRKKVLAVAVPLKKGDGDVPLPVTDLAPADGNVGHPGEGADRGDWRLRQASGAVFPFRELSTLQRWIVERKASRDDQVSPGGEAEAWRRLGDIPELRSFFSLVEKASRGGEPLSGPSPAEPRLTRGTEDPAWANDAASPPRRITRPQAPAPRPKRRVVWVALLALGLLGVAAGTVYLRRKAEADAVAQAIAPPPAPVVVAATPKPAEVKPVEPARDPEPAKAPAAGPVPEKAEAPPPVEAPPAEAQPAPKEADPAPKEAVRAPPRDEASTALRTALAQAREQRDRGRCEAALDLYGRALAIDGRNAAALAGRGACYLDLSRYAQAEASFEEALESDPRSAEALFGLAETHRYMGRKAEAVAGYERFLSVRPTGDDAAAARRLISQLKE
ncbi:MAG: family finger-like protein [Anaeromyxobacteraceae bacterium]|nr:family finger-like protein [Anaeromyxobacteraceae bacterium]